MKKSGAEKEKKIDELECALDLAERNV
jgi:hypothetical protein